MKREKGEENEGTKEMRKNSNKVCSRSTVAVMCPTQTSSAGKPCQKTATSERAAKRVARLFIQELTPCICLSRFRRAARARSRPSAARQRRVTRSVNVRDSVDVRNMQIGSANV